MCLLPRPRGGGGFNAIYVPHGDVPPIRVYFLASKQGAKFVRSLRARVPIHSTVWHPPVGFNFLTYLSFGQEINPSFDVFNILIVII